MPEAAFRRRDQGGRARRDATIRAMGIQSAEPQAASPRWRGCSNGASGPMRAELLALVDGAIGALDAGETDVAKARLQPLAHAIRSDVTGGGRNGV